MFRTLVTTALIIGALVSGSLGVGLLLASYADGTPINHEWLRFKGIIKEAGSSSGCTWHEDPYFIAPEQTQPAAFDLAPGEAFQTGDISGLTATFTFPATGAVYNGIRYFGTRSLPIIGGGVVAFEDYKDHIRVKFTSAGGGKYHVMWLSRGCRSQWATAN